MKKILLCLAITLLFSIHTYSQIGITQPIDYEICDENGNGFGFFDLEIKNLEILNGFDPANYNISYHVTLEDANNGTSAIASPYANTSNPQTIYARVFELSTGNFEITSFNLIVNSAIPNGFATEQIVCGFDGFGVFDLTLSSAEIIGPDASLIVQYFLTFQDATSNINPISNPEVFTNTTAYYQEIFFRIENVVSGCFFASPNTVLYLNVTDIPNFNSLSPLEACDLDGDGFEQFDLYSSTYDILAETDTNFQVTYHETQADADNFINSLPQYYINIVPSIQTIHVRLTGYNYECFQILPLDLVVNTDCVSASSVTAIICSEDPNNPVEIDLTTEEATILNGQDSLSFAISYYQSEAEAETAVNAIPNPQQYSEVSNTTLFVRVDDNQSDNYAIVTYHIVFNYGPEVYLNALYIICGDDPLVLTPSTFGSQNYSFIWSTGSTDPEIVVDIAGIYSVVITDNISGCSVELITEVSEGQLPELGTSPDIESCGANSIFDLTTSIPAILNGIDSDQVIISFHNDFNSAASNSNPIIDATSYVLSSLSETIFVRVQNSVNQCYQITTFTITATEVCTEIFNCADGPINNSFCYNNNFQAQYTYESADGLQLEVVFNAGQVEVDYDALEVLDSDGVTNLNPESTMYGNNGNLTGLIFTSSGSSITIRVASDQSVSCESSNYTPIDYTISCADPNALPFCNANLVTPENGTIDVLEITNLSWTHASGVVLGYKLSMGLTSGGTEILDNEDVGNVTSYDLETLDFETTYYITIVPYNTNGDAEDCIEQSFITRVNPYQTVVCEDGVINTTYCYENYDTSEFGFQSSDGLPLTIVFNAGGTEVDFDEVYVVDSNGTILNPDLEYGNNGDFTGLTYTSSGDNLTVRFNSDNIISCASGSSCCTAQFDFDVFCASSVGFIQVNAFVDANADTIYDADEFSFSNGYFTYEVNGDGMINTVNSSTGHFQIISGNEADVYDFTFNLYDESEACYDITTASFSNISVATGSTVTIDFPVVEEQSCEDLAVYLINNWAPPRPGFTNSNYLYLENLGFTNIASGTVEFVIDPQLVYNNTFGVNSAYTVTNTATGFTVDFVNLQPGDVENIGISITCPVSVALDEIVTNTATYLTDTNDMVVSNNYSTLSEIVVGSWDPNDITESHGPTVLHDEFSVSDEWLYYTIRFQNLGTAEAIFVRIENAIDNQLDKTTFQMLTSSHDFVVTRTEDDLEWYFDDINLPAEQDDAEGSIGFVYFRIKPLAGYDVGDIIPNTAAIYFDFNAPVITNRFETQFIEQALSVDGFDSFGFSLYPNPADEKVTIQLSSSNFETGNVNIYNIQGKAILQQVKFEGNSSVLDISNLESGMYFVELTVGDTATVQKLIVK